MTPPRPTDRIANVVGMPLAMQMIVIVVCALIGAQLVTLALTVLLPPGPATRWNMDEVAGALTGSDLSDRLERKPMVGPPDVSGQGWLISESSRDALAQRLDRPPGDVILAFYTQLPVGGVAVPTHTRSPLAKRATGSVSGFGGSLSSLLLGSADARSIPGGPPPGGAPGPSGMPGGHFPGGMPPGGVLARVPSMPRPAVPGGARPAGPASGNAIPGGRVPGTPAAVPGGAPAKSMNQSRQSGQNIGAGAGPPGTRPAGGAMGAGIASPAVSVPAISGPGISGPALPSLNDIPRATLPIAAPRPVVSTAPSDRPSTYPIPAPPIMLDNPATMPQVAPPTAALNPPLSVRPAPKTVPQPVVPGTPQPIPFRRAGDSMFALASPPFIEGDFVAATRQANGQWLAVAPRAEPFPNAWQKRVMLWFALSLAIVSPLAWLFARRIVVPLKDFAQAAEQLGRDPSATILPLSGPAEIGRAANAFNQMRHRLRAFVDDRTAMVGAISHDLRTPLTRLRFRIEDVPDDQREGLLKEVGDMEAMISQVIAFIRDASTPGPRKRVDFAELIAGSVADAQLVGGRVTIEHNLHIPVEVDPVGIRRLLGNLLENAIKYGESAKVRVSLLDGEAVAEIVDAGPGIPEAEFDRAFEPFYRSDNAHRSRQTGTGLGLAVCRSIARAHGGDVSFAHGGDGFAARVTVPAAFDSTLRIVA